MVEGEGVVADLSLQVVVAVVVFPSLWVLAALFWVVFPYPTFFHLILMATNAIARIVPIKKKAPAKMFVHLTTASNGPPTR